LAIVEVDWHDSVKRLCKVLPSVINLNQSIIRLQSTDITERGDSRWVDVFYTYSKKRKNGVKGNMFFPSEIVWWRIVINSYDISCEMAKAGIQVLSRIGFLSDVGPEITKSCKCETVYGRVVRIRDCG